MRTFSRVLLCLLAAAMPLAGQATFPGAVGQAAEALAWVDGSTQIIKITNTGCGDGGIHAALSDSTMDRVIVGGTVAGYFDYIVCPPGSPTIKSNVALLGSTFPDPGVHLVMHPAIGGALWVIEGDSILIDSVHLYGHPCTGFPGTSCGTNRHVVRAEGIEAVYLRNVSLVGGTAGGEFINLAANNQNRLGSITLHDVLMGGGYDTGPTSFLLQSDDCTRPCASGGAGINDFSIYRMGIIHGGGRQPYYTGGDILLTTGGLRNLQQIYSYIYNYGGGRGPQFRGQVEWDQIYTYNKPGNNTQAPRLQRWDDDLALANDSSSLYLPPQNVVVGLKPDTVATSWTQITVRSTGDAPIGADSTIHRRGTPLADPTVPLPISQTLDEWRIDVEVARNIGHWQKSACAGGRIAGYRSPMDSLLIAEAAAGTGSWRTSITAWTGEWPPTLPATGSACADTDGDGWFDGQETAHVGNLTQGPFDDFDSDGIVNLFELNFEGATPAPPSEPAETFPGLRAHYMALDTVTLSNGIQVLAPAQDTVPPLTLQVTWPKADDAAGPGIVVTCTSLPVGGGFKPTMTATELADTLAAWARYDTTTIKLVGAC